MKIGLMAVLALWTGVVYAQEPTPPKFQGAAPERFIARLIGESEKVVYETGVKAVELSPVVVIRCTIDTLGAVAKWQYLDYNCEGRDFRDVAPATSSTREVLEQALRRLERWTPARQDGHAIPYTFTLKLRFPIEKITHKQEGDPLLFMGKDPDEVFHEWASTHMRYFDNKESSYEGTISVTFQIEASGEITILKTSEFPDKKLVADILRIIRKSKGKWTPRKIDGVPVPSTYVYSVHFSGS